MTIQLERTESFPADIGLRVDFVTEASVEETLEDHPAAADFDAGRGETILIYEPQMMEARRLLLVGMGEEELEPVEAYELGGTLFSQASDTPCEEVHVDLEGFSQDSDLCRNLLRGVVMADYDYDDHQGDQDEDEEDDNPDLERLYLREAPDPVDVENQLNLGQSVNFARDLANAPANDLTPDQLAQVSRELADEHNNLDVEVWGPDRLAEENMNLHRSVAEGSGRPGRLVHLHYQPEENHAKLGLAGKGVTFDTGGISIKPSKGMDEMKYDMCGAAAVLGYVRAAAELELPVEIRALVPAAENMPGENATCPGNVIQGRNGTTVEIINTDAEGRLLLADSLAYLSESAEDLDLVVDLATLTGACIGALGHQAAGLMTPEEDWVEPFRQAGESTGERVWPFPLWEDYDEHLDSDTADVKNVGGKPGSILGGMFLRNFVDEELQDRWVHMDIAGVGWDMETKPHRPSKGSGYGVLLLHEFVRDQYLES